MSDELENIIDELYPTTECGQPCENCGDPVPDDTPRSMNLGVAQDGKYCNVICRMEGEEDDDR